MPGFLRALAPTPFVSVQDGGRVGWRRFGVSGAGAMDPAQLAIANALVGNPPEVGALEFAYAGGTWEVCATRCRLAVTGGGFAVTVDDAPVPVFAAITLRRGQMLRVGAAPDAVWGYLAVAGGFALPRALGSVATHARSGIGGLAGRCLATGDAVPLCLERAPLGRERRLKPPRRTEAPIAVVLGPQTERFTDAALDVLLGQPFRVSWRSDRMAYRLEGPPLAHRDGHDIVSDGTVPGNIQVPGNGAPLVLMRDCQTTGGYPKIGTVIASDLARLAQLRPGQELRFRALAVEEAQALHLRRAARLRRLLRTIPHLDAG